jgi:hypothetical protein
VYFGVDRLAILIATAVVVNRWGVQRPWLWSGTFSSNFGSKIHLRTKNLEKGEKGRKPTWRAHRGKVNNIRVVNGSGGVKLRSPILFRRMISKLSVKLRSALCA